MTEEIELIKKIRSLRVSKKKKKVYASEMAIKKIHVEIEGTKETIRSSRTSYANEKTQIINKMLSGASRVNDFIVLQKKEKLYDQKIEKMKSSNESLEIEMTEKRLKQKLDLEELARLEKAEIKIEEFIKMEAE